ncbi:MAG: hypothetical protein NC321_07730 [Clostridium sp.]|nr:hypothetical protein [Clostridium sp.]
MASEKIQKIPAVDEETMLDNRIILQENLWERNIRPDDFIKRQYDRTFINDLMFLKVQTMDDEMIKIKDRLSELEQYKRPRRKPDYNVLFIDESEQSKSDTLNKIDLSNKSDFQECREIVERAIEILVKWSETQDIKMQIQYAAVIVVKIENVKKKEFIQQNEIRKKICTLLRTVIRLNVADVIFTKEQILLLERGLSLLISENVQKEDMLQLSREFRKEHLMIMPAWE